MKLSTILTTLILIAQGYLLMGQKLVKHKIDPGITVSIGEDFSMMAENEVRSKYLSARAPLAAFSKNMSDVDFTINSNKTPWLDGDIELAARFYKTNIVNLFDTVLFRKEEVVMINENEFAVFEFVSTIYGDSESLQFRKNKNRYNYMAYTIRNGQLLVFNFNCPSVQEPKMSNLAAEIMATVRLK